MRIRLKLRFWEILQVKIANTIKKMSRIIYNIKYQKAVPGTLKLVPSDYRFAALAADYEAMKDMLYCDVPTFETVMSAVSKLEKEINAL